MAIDSHTPTSLVFPLSEERLSPCSKGPRPSQHTKCPNRGKCCFDIPNQSSQNSRKRTYEQKLLTDGFLRTRLPRPTPYNPNSEVIRLPEYLYFSIKTIVVTVRSQKKFRAFSSNFLRFYLSVLLTNSFAKSESISGNTTCPLVIVSRNLKYGPGSLLIRILTFFPILCPVSLANSSFACFVSMMSRAARLLLCECKLNSDVSTEFSSNSKTVFGNSTTISGILS